MRLEVIQTQGNGFTVVETSHNGESLTWTTGTYGKVRLNDPYRVFDEINGYWESLPKAAQDQIWAAYKEIKHYLEEVMDSYHIHRYIKRYLVKMYEAMSMDGMSKWLLTRGGLYIPSDIQDRIVPDARYPNPDQTYIKEDYINLATLALALRPLIPVWGEYIDQGGQGTGNDLYKEMEVVDLIQGTEIVDWPKGKSAYDKLHNYIRVAAEDTPVTLGSLWKGMGSSEIPGWLKSKTMVRRLTIVPLCDHSATHSIIANVYRYVISNLKPNDRRTSDRVRGKKPEGEGFDEDDKTSLLESYKIKQRVAYGDEVLFEVYTERPAEIAQHVDPAIDLKLLEQTLDVVPSVVDLDIHPHQVSLAQWVLARAFPPRAIEYVSKIAVNRLLATTQALLWQWGYLDLACLMQVERVNTTDQNIPGITQHARSGSRISRNYVDELMVLYKHVKPQRLKAGETEPNNRNGNLASQAINSVTKKVLAHTWQYNGPRELKKLAGQPEGSRILVVPPNIKNRITELAIFLAKLNH